MDDLINCHVLGCSKLVTNWFIVKFCPFMNESLKKFYNAPKFTILNRYTLVVEKFHKIKVVSIELSHLTKNKLKKLSLYMVGFSHTIRLKIH